MPPGSDSWQINVGRAWVVPAASVVLLELCRALHGLEHGTLLVSAAKLQAIVVESTEDEAAVVSMAKLDVFGSLDSAAEWSEYWSVDVQVHGRDVGSSMSGLAFYGEYANVTKRSGGDMVGMLGMLAMAEAAGPCLFWCWRRAWQSWRDPRR
jgi:hypothetical protein